MGKKIDQTNLKRFPHNGTLAVFILQDVLYVWTNLGKHSLFVSSVKTGTRRIIRLDEVSSVLHCLSCTTEDSSSRRLMGLVPVFTLETNNQTNNECVPKFFQTDNACSSIKTAININGITKSIEMLD